jgi:eukaryotic-like serine/threonine-protein kinase
MTFCPYCAQLPQFLDRQLGEAECREIELHVETCPLCAEELERLTASDGKGLPLPPVPLGDTAPPDSAPAADGELPAIPGYRLLRVLGRGGQSIVYLADDARLPRRVALKMIRAGSGAGPRELARFRIEAEALARLQHPHIIPIYEVSDYHGRPFFAMGYVDGGSLKDRLEDGLPPPRDAAQLAETLARAMHYAHQHAVLHRDLTPANVLLQEDNRTREHANHAKPEREDTTTLPSSLVSLRATLFTPKIIDFGLAKFLDEGAQHTGLTQPDGVQGTPSYMASEQAAGKIKEIGTLTDIYGLGAILYKMLTGHAPFEGASNREIINKVQSDQVLPLRPRRWRLEVPADLEAICLKCLEKEPARRYTSAEQLADELRNFLDHKPLVHTRRVGPVERLWRWCRRNPALAAATVLAATALLAVSAVSTLWAVREGKHAADLEVALDEAKYRRAENHLDHGLALCDRDDIGVGLLWLARALDRVPAGADDLRSVIHNQIAGWARRVIPLKACLDSPEPVTAAALSPDGRTVWAAGRDQCLRRWDVTRRELLGPPTRLTATVTAIAWGPRGKVLTVCNDGTAQLWDAEKGSRVGRPLPHEVTSAAWDPGGRYLVTGDDDGRVRFWDADGGTSDRPGFRQNGKVRVLTVSPDGRTVLTGEGKNARLWDAGSGQAVGDPVPHLGVVLAAAFSPDGRTVLTSSREDLTTRLWEAATGKPVVGPFRHKGMVEALAFSPDGQAFVTGGHDRTARIWSLGANQAVGQPLPHETEVRTVGFSSDGRTLLTAGFGNTLRVWEIALDRPLGLILPHGASVRAVGFLPQGGVAFTAGEDGAVRFWDPATGAAAGEPLTNPTDPIMGVTSSRDGGRVLARCWSPRAWLWDTRAPRQAGTPFGHPKGAKWVNSAALSPDAGIVLTGCNDGSVRFWNPVTATPWREDFAHRGPVYTAAFSPDGQTAATGGEDGRVLLWDVASGKALGQPLEHGGPVLSLAFSPGGKKLLTASADHRARQWDVSSGALLEPDLRHGGDVRTAAYSPDGRTILTGSADGTARLWDAANGKPLGRPLVHHDHVVAVAFSPNGTTALTGSWDGTARLWDVATGKSLGPPLSHAQAVWTVAFSPEGKAVLTGSADGTARLWQVPRPVAEPPGRIALELEALTGLSLDELDTVRVLDAAGWEERRRRSGN